MTTGLILGWRVAYIPNFGLFDSARISKSENPVSGPNKTWCLGLARFLTGVSIGPKLGVSPELSYIICLSIIYITFINSKSNPLIPALSHMPQPTDPAG